IAQCWPTAFAARTQISSTTPPCAAHQYSGTHQGYFPRSCAAAVEHCTCWPADATHHAPSAVASKHHSHEITPAARCDRAGRSLRTLWLARLREYLTSPIYTVTHTQH